MGIKSVYIKLHVDSDVVTSYSDLLEVAEQIYNVIQKNSVGVRIKYSWVSKSCDYSNTNQIEFEYDATKKDIIHELSWKLNIYEMQ